MDGISLKEFVISGTALTALGGIIGAWIKARYGRTEIKPQPFMVSAAPEYVTRAEFDKGMGAMSGRLDRIDGQLATDRKELTERLGALSRKLDENDEKAEERSCNLHRRIDPLAASIAESKGSIENHLADHRAGKA